MNEEIKQETELDLLYLLKLILRKWLLVGIVTGVTFVLATSYAYLRLDDEYTADSSMIVQVTGGDSSGYQDLLYGQRLVDTYAEIAKSNTVLNQVRSELNLDYSNGALRSMISVNSVNDTLIVQLKVVSGDSEEAANIATELVTTVQELTATYEGLESVEVLDTATVPTGPSGPNRMLYMAVGILLGGMIGVGIVLAIEFLDNNIKKPSDIETVLGLRLLGTIPDYDTDGEDNVK